jgi:HlyD family type I secretion membrane fusion protein
LQRIDIKAPKAGLVQALQVHTIGGVVSPGESLMEIVPQDDELIVNAQISPTDIDNVKLGQIAEVRLTALNFRSTPSIYGVVASISGDRIQDSRNKDPFFLARIEIPAEEQKKLEGLKLKAGMPAEVLIKAGERTALDYLLKPMTDAFVKGLNEE